MSKRDHFNNRHRKLAAEYLQRAKNIASEHNIIIPGIDSKEFHATHRFFVHTFTGFNLEEVDYYWKSAEYKDYKLYMLGLFEQTRAYTYAPDLATEVITMYLNPFKPNPAHARIVEIRIESIKNYTTNRAALQAAKDTNYNPRPISLGQKLLWLAGGFISIISAPFTGGVSLIGGLGTIISIAANNVIFNAQVLSYVIKSLSAGTNLSTKLQEAFFNTPAQSAKTIRAMYSNDPAQASSLENYASGAIYTQGAAGSQTYRPSQPYNPTRHIIAPHQSPDRNAAIDEYTQGRSHYTKAGSDGAMIGLNPKVYLAKIDPITTLDTFALEIMELNKALVKLSEIVAAGVSAFDTYNGSFKSTDDLINALYALNYGIKLARYLNKKTKEEMLENTKHYPRATRGMITSNFAEYREMLTAVRETKLIDTIPHPKASALQENIAERVEAGLNQHTSEPAINHALAQGAPKESQQQKRERIERYKQELQDFINSPTAEIGKHLKGKMLLHHYRDKLNEQSIAELESYPNTAWLLFETIKEWQESQPYTDKLLQGEIQLKAGDFFTQAQALQATAQFCRTLISVYTGGSSINNLFTSLRVFCGDSESCPHRELKPHPPKSRVYELMRYFSSRHPAFVRYSAIDTRKTIPYNQAIKHALFTYEYTKVINNGDGDPETIITTKDTPPIFMQKSWLGKWIPRADKPTLQEVLNFLTTPNNIAGDFLVAGARECLRRDFIKWK